MGNIVNEGIGVLNETDMALTIVLTNANIVHYDEDNVVPQSLFFRATGPFFFTVSAYPTKMKKNLADKSEILKENVNPSAVNAVEECNLVVEKMNVYGGINGS